MEASTLPPYYEENYTKKDKNIGETVDENVDKQSLQSPNDQKSSVTVIFHVINTVTQIILGAVMYGAFLVTISWRSDRFSDSFSPHIILCVIGYILLLCQAILAFEPNVGWASGLSKPRKRTTLAVMQILGSSLALLGCIIAIIDSSFMFNNLHIITGWMVMLLTVLSLVGGILNYRNPEKMSTGHNKTLLVCIEILTTLMALLCLCCGFIMWEHYTNDSSVIPAILLSVFAMVGVGASAIIKF